MGKCISFGKIEKKYFYEFLIYIILFIGFYIILSLKFNNDFEFIEKNRIINKISFYFFQTFFYVFEFIRNRKSSLQNDNISKAKNNFKLNILLIGLTSILELIAFFLFLFIIVMKDINQYIEIDYYYYIYLLCLLFSSLIFMKGSFYKNHYVSAIIILIIGIIQNLPYVSFAEIPFVIIFFLELLFFFLLSIIYGLYKILMDQYYFSPYKLSYIIGLINMTILLIISIILTFMPCSENAESFCLIENNGQKYFISFKSFFSYKNLYKIIFLLIINIFNSFQGLLIKMIIQDFTLSHTFLPVATSQFILYIYFYYKYYIKQIKYNFNYIKLLIIHLIIFVIDLFFGLVFIECIELNFCGLSKNIKKI